MTLVVAGALFFLNNTKEEPVVPEPTPEPVEVVETVPTSTQSVIGASVEGREIRVYTFGTGETDLLFIGGIHGGYEYNSILLAYEMVDYFQADMGNSIPDNITVHIVPNLNPDGLHIATGLEGRFLASDVTSYEMHTTGEGRFNANNVDLNRNFDCRWSDTAVWRSKSVGTGSGPFSEPEAVAIRDYIDLINPVAGVVWHSKANNVYGSECGGDVSPETLALMSVYAGAASYGEVPVFDAYVVNGAIEDWMASKNIASVSVELETRTDSEYQRNLAGVLATINLYK